MIKPWATGLGLLLLASGISAQSKSALTLDDLFSFVSIRSAKLAAGGAVAVIATTRADWKRNRFRDDLWLWRNGQDSLIPLAQSGHDRDPQWSSDGKHVAFISDRALVEPGSEGDSKDESDKEIGRVWIIDIAGGEAYPLYQEPLKVHSLAWDARQLGRAVQCRRTNLEGSARSETARMERRATLAR